MAISINIQRGTQITPVQADEGATVSTVMARNGIDTNANAVTCHGRPISLTATVREGDLYMVLPKVGKNGSFTVYISQGTERRGVSATESTTIAQLLRSAGIDATANSVTIDGRPVSLNGTLRDGDTLVVLPKVGKNGAGVSLKIQNGGQILDVTAQDTDSVSRILSAQGINTSNVSVTAGGRPVQLTSTVRDGDVLVVLPKVGKNGADYTVTVQQGSQALPATVPADSTVATVLRQVGINVDNVSVTVNGRPVQMTATVRDNELLTVLPKVGKNG